MISSLLAFDKRTRAARQLKAREKARMSGICFRVASERELSEIFCAAKLLSSQADAAHLCARSLVIARLANDFGRNVRETAVFIW